MNAGALYASPNTSSYQNWSVADEFTPKVHPRWEEFKELGNAALKDGNFEDAAACYQKAMSLCEGFASLRAFFEKLEALSEQSEARRGIVGARHDLEPIITVSYTHLTLPTILLV